MNIIETNRLCLRELSLEDLDDLSRVLMDSETMQYYPAPYSKDQVKDWILWNMDSYRLYGHGLWGIMLKNSQELIGDCGITMQEIDGETVPEIGYHIHKDYWNNGYATEAALECKQYAFNSLGYNRVFSYTSLNNVSSQRVAEKIGMETYKVFEKNGEQQIAQVAYKN